MYLFLMVLLSFALCYFSYDRTITFMYKSPTIDRLDDANNSLLILKIFTYLFLFIIFLIAMTTSKYFNAGALVYAFYIYLFFTLLYIILNFKFLKHILNVKFAEEELDKKTFEGIICAVKYENKRLIAIYRIKNDRIAIK